MRFDKVRLTQLREFDDDDWIAIGFKFGIGFCAAASIFAIIATLVVNAWFAYQDRNVWYSYAAHQLVAAQPSGRVNAGEVPVPAPPGGPAERDILVPSGPTHTESASVPPTAGPAPAPRSRPTR